MNVAKAMHVPVRKVIQHWMTDNEDTFDPVRGVGILVIVADTVFQYLTLASFNPINFMGSVATVLTIIAGSDKLRDTPLNRPSPPAPEGPSTVVSADKVTIRPPG
jgi:hypothetical protein